MSANIKNWIPAFAGVTLLFFNSCRAGPTEKPDPELRQRLIEAVNQADSFEHHFDAEVWLLDMSGRLKKFMPDDQQRLALLRMVHSESKRAKIAPELILSVIEVESRFDHFAISSTGAEGLMQIMPFWLKEVGKPDDNLLDVQTNLRFGCTILKYYLEKEKGGMVGALERYNGSYGKPNYPYLVINALNKRWYRS
jgi:soluble lytic murein transglycosylase-like protein